MRFRILGVIGTLGILSLNYAKADKTKQKLFVQSETSIGEGREESASSLGSVFEPFGTPVPSSDNEMSSASSLESQVSVSSTDEIGGESSPELQPTAIARSDSDPIHRAVAVWEQSDPGILLQALKRTQERSQLDSPLLLETKKLLFAELALKEGNLAAVERFLLPILESGESQMRSRAARVLFRGYMQQDKLREALVLSQKYLPILRVNDGYIEWESEWLALGKKLLNGTWDLEAKEIIFQIAAMYPGPKASYEAYDIFLQRLGGSPNSLWRSSRKEQAKKMMWEQGMNPKIREQALSLMGIDENRPIPQASVNTLNQAQLESLLEQLEFLGSVREHDWVVKLGKYLSGATSYGGDFKRERILIALGRSFNLTGRYSEAVAVYKEVMRKFPKSPYGRVAKERLFTSLHYAKRYNEELKLYTGSKAYPEKMWLLYLMGKFDEAYRMGQELLNKKGKEVPRVLYWMGRIDEKESRKEQALARFESIQRQFANSSYAVWARWRTRILQGSEEVSSFSPDKFTTTERRFDSGVAAEFSLDTNYFGRSYRQEAIKATQGLGNPPQRSLSEIEWQNTLKLEREVWSRAWPYAYRLIAETVGVKANLSPFFVLSIMRTESFFNPIVVSPVGAIGLMQIMPKTGHLIAAKLSDSDFVPPMLSRPGLNMAYGAWYLRYLVDYFEGNYILAIAAYNGGPQAVDRWYDNNPGLSLDEFAENIPFDQTREYVAKVLQNINTYSRLYSEGGRAFDMALPEKIKKSKRVVGIF